VPHGPLHLVVGSTGLKLFARGEGQEAKHGRAPRSWRKWHLALDAETGREDLIEIRHCRGADHRRRFALQLCMLRAHGRFLDDYRQAPLRIVNHLSRQLDLPPVLLLDRLRRDPTGRVQAQRIRRYLGIRSFDRAAEADLRDWVRQGAVEGRSVAELLRRAEDRLRAWQVMVPGASTLARIVASEGARATTELFTIVAQRDQPAARGPGGRRPLQPVPTAMR
jgi:hypothetical protein